MIMLILFIQMIASQVAYAYVNINLDNFEMGYPVRFKKVCQSGQDRFNSILGISIAQCVKECSARAHCEALSFRRRVHVCELFTSSNESHLYPGNCIYIRKINIKTIKEPCGCNYGEVCEASDSGTGFCKIKECLNTTVPKHSEIVGNQRKVGKMIRYKCNRGFTAAANNTIAECIDTGVWNAYSKCVQAPTLGLSCTTDADCFETEGRCINGLCFCHPFYRYNTALKDCTKVCNGLTDSFAVKYNKVIRGFNDIEVPTVYPTKEECKLGCISDPSCQSFETLKDNGTYTCTKSSLSHEMALDAIPGLLDFNPNVQLHSRICG